jgi:hypothetical protein
LPTNAVRRWYLLKELAVTKNIAYLRHRPSRGMEAKGALAFLGDGHLRVVYEVDPPARRDLAVSKLNILTRRSASSAGKGASHRDN